jgi:hypothetical protein
VSVNDPPKATSGSCCAIVRLSFILMRTHRVINKPIRKLVLNPITERNKKEWLQALHLCSLAMMPEEVKSKTVYESESETESEYESDEYEYEEMVSDRAVADIFLLAQTVPILPVRQYAVR